MTISLSRSGKYATSILPPERDVIVDICVDYIFFRETRWARATAGRSLKVWVKCVSDRAAVKFRNEFKNFSPDGFIQGQPRRSEQVKGYLHADSGYGTVIRAAMNRTIVAWDSPLTMPVKQRTQMKAREMLTYELHREVAARKESKRREGANAREAENGG